MYSQKHIDSTPCQAGFEEYELLTLARRKREILSNQNDHEYYQRLCDTYGRDLIDEILLYRPKLPLEALEEFLVLFANSH